MREVSLITTFRWLKVSAPPGVYEIMPTVNIIVGDELVAKYLNAEFQKAAGEIEYQHFKQANHLVVSLPEEVEYWDDFVSGEEILHCWMVWVDWALQDSWLVKDNCFISEVAYCRSKLSGEYRWSNNSLYTQASASDGDRQRSVEFVESDIKYWSERLNSLRSHLDGKGYSILTPVLSKKATRFDRFLSFTQIARRSSTPAMKIAQMCSALESLFSTSTTELTHRLSERVAFFAGENPEDKELIYQLMKKAYGVRSQVTHGSHISSALSGLAPELSSKLLDLLRKITFKVLEDPHSADVVYGDDEFIENHFRRCLFF
ncbi:hypothetical protein K3169_13775 [Pseudomonas phytophila]|uniref:Apea-like HEPN domain-containing protein n=1 Tax=Pseudomonas phytophila TaxID=2867264 RepID=A0ABY6FLP1_9PSED|nr:HEPN domain-containing protein [Pseudomonas phytophila]UXZ98852.1 hypothetical protein K3169_13775 [Pseudomonas phytophila]